MAARTKAVTSFTLGTLHYGDRTVRQLPQLARVLRAVRLQAIDLANQAKGQRAERDLGIEGDPGRGRSAGEMAGGIFAESFA